MREMATLITGLLMGVFCSCTRTDSIAGPSTEQGNPVMIGLVLDKNVPVADARVTVYKYVPVGDVSEVLGVELVKLKTDETGRFELGTIAVGEYAIQCSHPDSSRSAFKKISISDMFTTMLDTFLLKSPGSMRGCVTRGGLLDQGGNLTIRDGDIRVVIIDMNMSTVTGPGGKYHFSDLPPGTYSIAFYPGGSFFASTMSDIVVISGSETVVDTVHLEPIPWVKPSKPDSLTAEYDTVHNIIKLQWNPVLRSNLLGYVIERREDSSILNPLEIFTKDTMYIDSVGTIPDGTIVYYIVRAMTEQFERSYPEGPVSITIRQQNGIE